MLFYIVLYAKCSSSYFTVDCLLAYKPSISCCALYCYYRYSIVLPIAIVLLSLVVKSYTMQVLRAKCLQQLTIYVSKLHCFFIY
jgi:hypothetical protein